MFDTDQLLSGLVQGIKEKVPGAVYDQSTAMNLAETALAEVIRQAVAQHARELLPQQGGAGALVGAAASLFGQVSGMFGGGAGVGSLLQRALDSTDLDEQLRDALVDGFARYLKDNAGRLAKVALEAISEGLKGG